MTKWYVFHNLRYRQRKVPIVNSFQLSWSQGLRSCERTGPQLNIKMISYQYRKSHCGDKTSLRPSYLHNGISYTGRTMSLYWTRALVLTKIWPEVYKSRLWCWLGNQISSPSGNSSSFTAGARNRSFFNRTNTHKNHCGHTHIHIGPY